MPYSYFLSYESPMAEGLLWSLIAVSCDANAKFIVIEDETGITFEFDIELSQEKIVSCLTLATEDLNIT
jgi:hypothetical protein